MTIEHSVNEKPWILALDTALGGCSVGLVHALDGRGMADMRAMPRGHSEILMPMIVDLMGGAGVKFSELGRIVVTIGPGGFTGLRIGLSAARSLATALDIPVDGVLTTESIVQKIMNDNNEISNDILVVMETKRTDFYTHHFSPEGLALSPVKSMEIPDFLREFRSGGLTLAGDGVERLVQTLGAACPAGWRVMPGYNLPDPLEMVTVALRGNVHPPEPLYLRDADVTLSKKVQRVITP